MDQEKFVSKYIEILNTTISEAIQKNIVAQAQKNVLETELNELLQQHEKLLSEKNKENEKLKLEINALRQQVGSMNTTLHESSIAKQHFETFKNELSICRKENDDLKELIAKKDEELAKYKPAPVPVIINKLGKKNTTTSETKSSKVKSVKDAGSF